MDFSLPSTASRWRLSASNVTLNVFRALRSSMRASSMRFSRADVVAAVLLRAEAVAGLEPERRESLDERERAEPSAMPAEAEALRFSDAAAAAACARRAVDVGVPASLTSLRSRRRGGPCSAARSGNVMSLRSWRRGDSSCLFWHVLAARCVLRCASPTNHPPNQPTNQPTNRATSAAVGQPRATWRARSMMDNAPGSPRNGSLNGTRWWFFDNAAARGFMKGGMASTVGNRITIQSTCTERKRVRCTHTQRSYVAHTGGGGGVLRLGNTIRGSHRTISSILRKLDACLACLAFHVQLPQQVLVASETAGGLGMWCTVEQTAADTPCSIPCLSRNPCTPGHKPQKPSTHERFGELRCKQTIRQVNNETHLGTTAPLYT